MNIETEYIKEYFFKNKYPAYNKYAEKQNISKIYSVKNFNTCKNKYVNTQLDEKSLYNALKIIHSELEIKGTNNTGTLINATLEQLININK